MTSFKQFKLLQKQIERIISKAENEALEEGVDITSPEFQELLLKLKRKLLEARGITLVEYEQLEEELARKKEVDEDTI